MKFKLIKTNMGNIHLKLELYVTEPADLDADCLYMDFVKYNKRFFKFWDWIAHVKMYYRAKAYKNEWVRKMANSIEQNRIVTEFEV